MAACPAGPSARWPAAPLRHGRWRCCWRSCSPTPQPSSWARARRRAMPPWMAACTARRASRMCCAGRQVRGRLLGAAGLMGTCACVLHVAGSIAVRPACRLLRLLLSPRSAGHRLPGRAAGGGRHGATPGGPRRGRGAAARARQPRGAGGAGRQPARAGRPEQPAGGGLLRARARRPAAAVAGGRAAAVGPGARGGWLPPGGRRRRGAAHHPARRLPWLLQPPGRPGHAAAAGPAAGAPAGGGEGAVAAGRQR